MIAALLALALGSAESGFAQPARPKENTPATFQPEARKHVSPKRPEEPIDMNPLQTPAGGVTRAILPVVTMAPTRSSFLASWSSVGDATGYRIDVSTDPSFRSYVSGYEHCDVGNVTSRIVSRLNPGTKYYYRVQPYNSAGAGPNSEMAAATTTTASGLVINPTFDSSITGNPQSAAIQSMINQAVALYQPLFGDSVTAEILFRYSDTEPDGTPLDGPIAESLYVVYGVPWGAYIFNLKADAKTTNDTTANAGLPTLPMSPNLVTASANGRALGLDTPPAMFADGTVGGWRSLRRHRDTQFRRTTPIYPAAQQRQLRRTTAYGARNRRDPRIGIIPRRPSVEFRLSSAGSVQLVGSRHEEPYRPRHTLLFDRQWKHQHCRFQSRPDRRFRGLAERVVSAIHPLCPKRLCLSGTGLGYHRDLA